ncbi:MAG: GreA/GreB family elongation factor [Patescibacteria group bacterium]|nr:GreA/GreB family elongation factor [Patescibacteria group bacterium]
MQIPYRKPGKYTHLVQDPHITEARAIAIANKLAGLKKNIRPKLMEEVALLAQGGDFSENAGYQAAKGRLRNINEKIINYEAQLRRAIIIKKQKQIDKVQLGHTVTIESGGKKKKYLILGSAETNPSKGIISQNSPLGEKLMGRRVGEVIKISVGNKEVEYRIVEIE